MSKPTEPVSDEPFPEARVRSVRDPCTSVDFALPKRTRNWLLLRGLILAISPYVLFFSALSLGLKNSPFGMDAFELALYYAIPGCLVAQWSMIGSFCLLSCQPAGKRCLILTGWLLCIGTTGLAPAVPGALMHLARPDLEKMVNESIETLPWNDAIITLVEISVLLFYDALWLPVTITLALLPTFAMKVVRRWTLGPRACDIQPLAATLQSYLMATAMCAVAIVCAKWRLELLIAYYGDFVSVSREILQFVTSATPGALTAGVVHAICLADMADRGQRSWRPWLWRLVMALVFGASTVTLLYFVGWMVESEMFADVSLSEVALTNGILASTSSLFFWCGCRWMRQSGLRLSGQLRES